MSIENYTASDLHKDLVKLFNDLKSGAVSSKEAKEMNNAAGKIISLAKVQVEYAAIREEKPFIPFLSCSEEKGGES